MKELENKVILISGAAGALGKECSKAMVNEGAKLGLFDLSENVLELSKELNKKGSDTIAFRGSISDEEDVRRFINLTNERFDQIDGAVNIAAIYKGLKNQDLLEIPYEEWNKVLEVNLTGTWIFSKEAARKMKARHIGSIVNISSATVFFGAPGMLHYVASKSAIIGMTRAMAQELGPNGIRVNCIAPGLLPTESSLDRISKDYLQQIKSTAALRKVATPMDIVNAIVFLMSSRSESITGQTIVIDGGRVFL